MEELFNGIILPDKTRVKFSKSVQKIQVVDIKIKNHPAFNKKGSKQVIATELIKEGEYIGSYGGQIKYNDKDPEIDRLNWNPYQLTPNDEDDYYVDGETIGNELKYINDPKDVGSKGPNAKFWQSNKTLKGFYTCEIEALRDIQPQEEILVSYGDKYWTSLQKWYERKNPFTCPNCDYRTDNKIYLQSHLRRQHDSYNSYECKYCNKEYKSRNALNQHLYKHTKKIMYKCNLCEYTTLTYSSLYNHKEYHHSGKVYKCFECGITTHNSSGLKRHIEAIHEKIHEKKKPSKCDQCDYSCSRQSNLKKHIDAVHEKKKPYICELCDHSFSQKSNLKKHIETIHEKKGSFKCDQCGYNFTQKGDLKRHIETIHEKKKQFKCDQCDYTCSQKAYLKIHVRAIHQKLKPFKCDYCDKLFSQKCNLKTHIIKHHQKKRVMESEDQREENYLNFPSLESPVKKSRIINEDY
jgi:hypothetical protein